MSDVSPKGASDGHESSQGAETKPDPLRAFLLQNDELFSFVVTLFEGRVPTDKRDEVLHLSAELRRSVEENCTLCRMAHLRHAANIPKDNRRSRFLLRMVISKMSHLFRGSPPVVPPAIIDGIDIYLRRAFGDQIYSELSSEASRLQNSITYRNDRDLWLRRQDNLQWRRFFDLVLIHLLLRFENFQAGKRTFISRVEPVMVEHARVQFSETLFKLVFEALFADYWHELQEAEQRIRWDFMFGAEAPKRIEAILIQGLGRKPASAPALGKPAAKPALKK